MKKAAAVLLAAAFIVALPFIFGQRRPGHGENGGALVLTVVSPHNEAIRHEFGRGFSRWHLDRYGVPATVDWRVIGGTTEIMRYLASEYAGSFEGWCERTGREFPPRARSAILSAEMPKEAGTVRDRWLDFRTNDSPAIASSRIDVFFGGGTYDHGKASAQGLTVRPWQEGCEPKGIVDDGHGGVLIPKEFSGETWRNGFYYGTVLSTFGICWNKDRLADLGVSSPPARWRDLAREEFFGQVGLADPTKSGSVAKAYEMIIQEAIAERISACGGAETPENVRDGWLSGLNLVRLIGANAKYFTDSAGKVPIDVGTGALALGVSIDFFGRFQAEHAKTPDGKGHMEYLTPRGGSCVSADPVSLLRGAPHGGLGRRFIEYLLCEEGQRLWNYRPGTEGGPGRYSLRRLPIRRDFYPSGNAAMSAVHARNLANCSDDLSSPEINPYAIGALFTYRPEWTGRHFSIQRDLIRAMAIDSGSELRAAWKAIIENGGPEENPEAMEMLFRMPQRPLPLTWSSAVGEYKEVHRLEYMREWTSEFRANYRKAKRLAMAGRAKDGKVR